MVGVVRFEKENQERAHPAIQGSCPPLGFFIFLLKITVDWLHVCGVVTAMAGPYEDLVIIPAAKNCMLMMPVFVLFSEGFGQPMHYLERTAQTKVFTASLHSLLNDPVILLECARLHEHANTTSSLCVHS
eukprot:scaffold276875_cov21-Tisochrysis_lutea.AAC.2